MGKLYFWYSTMNAGKSTMLLQAAHNYIERGMLVFLLTAKLDTRSGTGRISSRIGLGADAECFTPQTDIYARLQEQVAKEELSCIFVDEAQFLTKEQVWQLARFVDDWKMPVMCYGLRVDFRGELFPGSKTLLALADEMKEVRTVCHCGKKATMAVRRDGNGKAIREGDQVCIGGNEVYVSLCRKHWREEMGDPGGPSDATKIGASKVLRGGADELPPSTPTGKKPLAAECTECADKENELCDGELAKKLAGGCALGSMDTAIPVAAYEGRSLESPN